MASRASSKQELVDRIFRACMAEDARTLEEMRTRIRWNVGHGTSYASWDPTDHELQIMISRNAMGDGDWEYFPAYSNPPRYVSKARLARLAQLVEDGAATQREVNEFRNQLADVEQGVIHWKAKHARARQKTTELIALYNNVSHHKMEDS